MGYLIGIDCGATGTDIILYDIDTGASKTVRQAAVNYNLLGLEDTVKKLSAIIKKSAGSKLKNTDYIIAGISGAGNKNVKKNIKSKLKKALNFKNIEIYPDTEIAFSASFGSDEVNCGILIAGTGSVLYYKNGKGVITKIGGWGRHIGDEGSGYWIAKSALHKMTQYYDGRLPESALAGRLNKDLKINRDTIVQNIYHNNFEISRVTKLVFECAESGDRVCSLIIKDSAEALLKHFIPLKKEKGVIALCGSLFSKEELLEKYLRKLVKQNYPGIKLVKPELPPVWGAIRLGISRLRV